MSGDLVRAPTREGQPGKCGDCSLCCELMRVDLGEFMPKPAGQPCRHQCAGGCGIYEARPKACEGFECGWLISQRYQMLKMPPELRPDRCGVVLEVNSVGSWVAHCREPDAWRGPAISRFLLDRARMGAAILIEDGERTWRLSEKGKLEPIFKLGTNRRNEAKYLWINPTLGMEARA